MLEGEEVEAGEEGRRRVRSGDVLVHQPFDAHCNYISTRGLTVLCLPWPANFDLPPMGHLDDADAIVRLAERDAFAATAETIATMVRRDDRLADWPDLLAENLRSFDGLSLRDWADQAGLAPETLSRGFRKLYGASPARYRFEYRAREAWRQIVRTTHSLTEIAMSCGFADQSHMSRAVRAITGSSPLNWRLGRSSLFKTVSATLS